MKLAIATPLIIEYEIAANLKTVLAYIAEAAQGGADLLLFPETTLTGLVISDNYEMDKQYALPISSDLLKEIAAAAKELKPVPHRLQLIERGGMTIIDDAYNANPAGCLEATAVLSWFENMKKIAVTPGLVEPGGAEYEHNYNFGLALAEVCDIIILVGEQRAKPMADAIKTTDFNPVNLIIIKAFADAMEKLKGIVDKDTVVLFENDLPDNF